MLWRRSLVRSNHWKFGHPPTPYRWRHRHFRFRYTAFKQAKIRACNAALTMTSSTYRFRSSASKFSQCTPMEIGFLVVTPQHQLPSWRSIVRLTHIKFGHTPTPYRWRHRHFRFRYMLLRHSTTYEYGNRFFTARQHSLLCRALY